MIVENKTLILATLLLFFTGYLYFFSNDVETDKNFLVTEDNIQEVNFRTLQFAVRSNQNIFDVLKKISSKPVFPNETLMDQTWTLFMLDKNYPNIKKHFLNLLYYKYMAFINPKRSILFFLQESVNVTLPYNLRGLNLDSAVRIVLNSYGNLDTYMQIFEDVLPYPAYLSPYKTNNDKLLALAEFSYSTYRSFGSASNFLYLDYRKYQVEKNSAEKIKIGQEIVSTTSRYTKSIADNLKYDEEIGSNLYLDTYILWGLILAKEQREGLYILKPEDVQLADINAFLDKYLSTDIPGISQSQKFYLFKAYYFAMQNNSQKVVECLVKFEELTKGDNPKSIFYYDLLENTEKNNDLNYFRTFKPDFLLAK